MDAEIQWGDVEEAEPEVQLRPDQNRHFAIAAYGEPRRGELPIFVDLDVLRDMEEHALSDTSVELGGVMLGGQYHDEDGQPFVVVSDALRAKHYESTKGSFKFTHDTWSQITRERDEFPEELQMVGWYHTHPDWGVFLSGMDTFICDNFFNKTLDVALVIDPCRGDRGFFQWSHGSGERLPRTGGFHLMASRFREYELQEYAQQLESNDPMRTQPGYGSGPYPAPVINNIPDRSPWVGIGVLGILAVQACLTMLIAWKMINPSAPAKDGQAIAALNERLDDVSKSQTSDELDAREARLIAQAERLKAREALVDQLVGSLSDGTDGIAGKLDEARNENAALRNSQAGYTALRTENEELSAQVSDVTDKLQTASDRIETLVTKRQDLAKISDARKIEIDELTDKLDKASDELTTTKDELDTVKGLFRESAPDDYAAWEKLSPEDTVGEAGTRWTWINFAAVIGVVVLAAGGIAAVAMTKGKDPPSEEADGETK